MITISLSNALDAFALYGIILFVFSIFCVANDKYDCSESSLNMLTENFIIVSFLIINGIFWVLVWIKQWLMLTVL